MRRTRRRASGASSSQTSTPRSHTSSSDSRCTSETPHTHVRRPCLLASSPFWMVKLRCCGLALTRMPCRAVTSCEPPLATAGALVSALNAAPRAGLPAGRTATARCGAATTQRAFAPFWTRAAPQASPSSSTSQPPGAYAGREASAAHRQLIGCAVTASDSLNLTHSRPLPIGAGRAR